MPRKWRRIFNPPSGPTTKALCQPPPPPLDPLSTPPLGLGSRTEVQSPPWCADKPTQRKVWNTQDPEGS